MGAIHVTVALRASQKSRKKYEADFLVDTGATDEHGIRAVEKPVHVHDFHATILHLMGIDHERLTYRHGGRDYRLTDVEGHVVKDVLA